jgi:hypothetical protein
MAWGPFLNQAWVTSRNAPVGPRRLLVARSRAIFRVAPPARPLVQVTGGTVPRASIAARKAARAFARGPSQPGQFARDMAAAATWIAVAARAPEVSRFRYGITSTASRAATRPPAWCRRC